MIRYLWGMGIMKKSIVLTLLILLVFTTGCGLMPGTELYLSQTLNILGLWSVYYKTGRITFKFDESYALTGDENYYDLISLIRNGDQQDKDQMAVYVFCSENDIYQGREAIFDSSKLTISFSIDDIGKDIYYILITHKERQFGIDVEDPHYFEQYNIKPITVEKYSYHVYCPDYLFSDNEKINKSLINCIESQGRFQYTDIYVYDYQYFASDNDVTVYAYGYSNGAVVDSLNYHANTNNPRGYVPGFIRDPVTRGPDPVLDPDTNDLIDPELYVPVLIRFIRDYKDIVRQSRSDHVYGTYLLKYELSSDMLFYEFIINDHFLIDVDAHTGEIINIDEWCARQLRCNSYISDF